MRSSDRSARAATSSAATASLHRWRSTICWPSSMPGHTGRPWLRTTTAGHFRSRCSSTKDAGASSAAGRQSTTCWRWRPKADRGSLIPSQPVSAAAPIRMGYLIVFEGLDQSGKQTQAELLRDRLKDEGWKARLVSFPDYGTTIGEEIARALQGEREYGADVMQLLYIANRYERKPDLQRWLEGGLVLVCDRYVASSIAYGEAQGLDPLWLMDAQKFLPAPSLTIMLDIAPETAVARKAVDRDRYERDLAMQG